jgi:hypothetical protein
MESFRACSEIGHRMKPLLDGNITATRKSRLLLLAPRPEELEYSTNEELLRPRRRLPGEDYRIEGASATSNVFQAAIILIDASGKYTSCPISATAYILFDRDIPPGTLMPQVQIGQHGP